jgi:hypothetical protein
MNISTALSEEPDTVLDILVLNNLLRRVKMNGEVSRAKLWV